MTTATGHARTDHADSDRTGSDAPWLIVAGREIAVKLRDRGFIISTLSTLAIIVIAFGASFLMASRTETTTVAVAEPAAAQLVAAADEAPEQAGAGPTELLVEERADAAAVTDAVRSEQVDVGLVREDGGWTLVGRDSVPGSVTASVSSAVAAAALDANAREAGTTVEALTAGSHVGERLLEEGASDEGVRFVAGFAFVFLFYMAAILFGYAIANSVVEEKQSRIVEILAAAIPLRQLLVGKVVGSTVLALGQMTIFVGLGLLGLSFTDYSSMLPAIGAAAGWYLGFFLLGFVALAALFAVAGALATRAEDVQSTASPLIMAVAVAAFSGLFLEGAGLTVASYVPLVSVVAMPLRLLGGEAAWWEPVLSLGVTAAFTAGVILLAERIYRRSLMQTGGKLTYRQALALEE